MPDNIPDNLPLKEIYEDLAQPSVKAVGTIISLPFRAIRVKLSPFEQWVINGEYNLDKVAHSVRDKLNDIDESKIISPAPYVAVPALQAITYCMDNDELREAYANLLATAMNSDTANKAHPAFTEIIKQMSPLEAKVLKATKGLSIPVCDLRIQRKTSSQFSIKSLEAFPFARPFAEGFYLFKNLASVSIDGFDDIYITKAIENLARLGILSIDATVLTRNSYAPFTSNNTFIRQLQFSEDYIVQQASESNPLDEKREFFLNAEFAAIPKSLYATTFGKAFIEVCIG